jgi:hypothetical protein
VTNDQRKKVRRPLNLEATLLQEGSAPLQCKVLDISDSGARFTIEQAVSLPAEFTLVFTRVGAPFRQCRRMWQNGEIVGATFAAETYDQKIDRGLRPPVEMATGLNEADPQS